MHVLGTPPAFILSQDQTLRLRGGHRCPLAFDLGFGPRLAPSRGVRLGPGFRTTRFMCLAMLILASQYPVFKVLRRPCGRPALSSFSEAQGDILPNRLPAVKNFFPVSRKSFPGRRSRALSREAGGTGAAPLSRKTQPEYITRPGRSAQGGNLKNWELFSQAQG